MTRRPPLPWWKRKHATMIDGAARRVGLRATPRLDGWLEILDEHGKTVAEARFSQTSGTMSAATGRTTTGAGRSFRVDYSNHHTAREAVDGFVDWLRNGRADDYDVRRAAMDRRVEAARFALEPPQAVAATGDNAIVSDFTTRKRLP